MVKLLKVVFVSTVVFASNIAWGLETEDRHHRLAPAIALHDIIDQVPLAPVVQFEYRICCRWKTLRPAVGTLVSGDGSWYSWTGIRSELESSRKPIMFSINTAIGYYRQGKGALLGHPLEFRSGFELYHRFENDSYLGLTFHHLSNASIGDRNPGTEILGLTYDFPVSQKERSIRKP